MKDLFINHSHKYLLNTLYLFHIRVSRMLSTDDRNTIKKLRQLRKNNPAQTPMRTIPTKVSTQYQLWAPWVPECLLHSYINQWCVEIRTDLCTRQNIHIFVLKHRIRSCEIGCMLSVLTGFVAKCVNNIHDDTRCLIRNHYFLHSSRKYV